MRSIVVHICSTTVMTIGVRMAAIRAIIAVRALCPRVLLIVLKRRHSMGFMTTLAMVAGPIRCCASLTGRIRSMSSTVAEISVVVWYWLSVFAGYGPCLV